MIFLYRFILLFFLIFAFSLAYSQDNPDDKKVVQLSGIILDADSLDPLPFVTVVVKNAKRGTVTDYFGFFTIVARAGDSISFSYVGYKTETFGIPEQPEESSIYLIYKIKKDTVLLKEATILPWPTREQFKDAFLSLRVQDDDYDRAMKNLAAEQIKERYFATGTMDGDLNYLNALQQRQYQMYYAGQLPPVNLLNPVAWAKFIRAWKTGQLKDPRKK